MAKFNRVLRESCCVVVAIFHVPHTFLFARFKPAFSFANIALVVVLVIYFVNIGETKRWFKMRKKKTYEGREKLRQQRNSSL